MQLIDSPLLYGILNRISIRPTLLSRDGTSLNHRIRNEDIRKGLDVAEIEDTMRTNVYVDLFTSKDELELSAHVQYHNCISTNTYYSN